MTKQDSLLIKGLAILMMLFLHLFNSIENCNLASPLIMIGDVPLIFYLTRACGPVPIFMFVSGLGLYISYKSSPQLFKKKNLKRLLKLYIHFWLILSIFLIIGHMFNPKLYPGSFIELVKNYSSIYYTYNSTYWFLAPYTLIALSSIYIFNIIDKMPYLLTLAIAYIINLCTSYIISRYGKLYLFDNVWAYTPILYFHLLFPFVLGVICVKTGFWGIIEILKTKVNGYFLWFILVLLILLRCMVASSAFHTFFVFFVIIFFVSAPKFGIIENLFVKLGNHSMNMWFIHAWLYSYLFKDFIYGFKFPILIFVALIICSFVTSIVINWILKPIIKYVK